MSEGQRGPLRDDQAKNATDKSFAGVSAQQKARLNSRPFMKSESMDRRFGPPSRTALPRPVPAMQSLVSLDTSYSSTLPGALSRPPETAPIVLFDDEPLRLRVFIDKSIVEIFVNDQQCVAARVYPGSDDSVGVSLRAQGSAAILESLDAWQMANIYE